MYGHWRQLSMRLHSLVLVLVTLLLVTTAMASDRVALVIGNGAYRYATELPNPANDANAIGRTLETMGFEVIKGIDLD
ncbi:MAG: caspase family protein, partial [Verrucomicrobiaceae bacterium]